MMGNMSPHRTCCTDGIHLSRSGIGGRPCRADAGSGTLQRRLARWRRHVVPTAHEAPPIIAYPPRRRHRTVTAATERRGATRRRGQLSRIPNWWERSFWEPTVALAIRDHCRPGDVVFDVGANAGALSMLMSRLVGPRGIVCAFEASPRIVDKTHYNLVKAGCNNVTLFHKAVWHTSGARVNMAAGSHLNDRIEEAATGMSVRTIALDDLANVGGFRPSFIKMDIEGAEYDALRGMTRLVREVRPVLIIEQSPNDMRCHSFLSELAVAMDLASYEHIRSGADFRRSTSVANVLFVAQEAAGKNPYFDRSEPETIANLFSRPIRSCAKWRHPFAGSTRTRAWFATSSAPISLPMVPTTRCSLVWKQMAK